MSGRSISARLLLSYLLVAAVPLAGLAVFYLVSFKESLTETALENIHAVADKKAIQIDDYMAERLADARQLARRDRIRKGLAATGEAFRQGGLDSPAYLAAASPLREALGSEDGSEAYYDLLLIDSAGNVVFSLAREADLGSNLRHGPYRETQLAQAWALAMRTLQTQVSGFELYAPSAGRPAAFLVAPVLDEGRLLGMLALQLDLGQFEAVTADRTGLGRGGETVLAQRRGEEVLYTSPLRYVGNAAYRFRLPFDKAPLAMQKALTSGHGQGIVRDMAGKERVAAWRYLPALDSGMVVKMDTAEALAPAARLQRAAYLALGLFMLLSGAAAYFFGRGLSRPIQVLTRVADRIAAGELPHRVPAASIDELKQLSLAFNHMAEALADARDNLEAKVEARSRELREITALQNAILDEAGALIVVFDREGRIRRFNRACEKLSQYSFAEVEGRFVWDFLLPPEECERGREEGFIDLVQNPQNAHASYTNHWVARDGTKRLIEWTNTLLLDERGGMEFMVSIGIDITEKSQARAAMEENEKRLKDAQRIAQVGSWELDHVSGRLTWSDEIFRIFELDPARFGASYEAFLAAVHPEDRKRVDRAFAESLAGHAPYEISHRLRLPDGRVKWVNERGETSFDAQGRPLGSSGTVQDITARRQAEDQLRLYASMFEYSGQAILISDSDNRIVAVNPAFTRLTGYELDEIRGKNPNVLASGKTSGETYRELWASLEQFGHWQGEIIDRRKDGSLYPKWISISVVRDPEGRVSHYVASFIDITERKAAEAQISQLAFHDTLTGLLNRFSLKSQLEQALAMARREQRALAVAFLDLDRFKTINDTLGHAVGDELLMEVAHRLRQDVRDSDIVARLGGDEFVVVLTDVEDAAAAARVADKILKSLAQPYRIGENELHTSASIGLAFFPDDGEDGDTLMKNADTAMYHAKSSGRNNIQFFTTEMNEAAAKRLHLEHDLRLAVEAGQFELRYQPQLDARNGRIVGVEALVRWRHPHEGLVPPAEFIPIAEETGLILQLGDWVLDEGCRQLRAWRDMGLKELRLAVNLSAHQLYSADLLAQVVQILQKHGLSGIDLEMEITESVAMAEPRRSISQLRTLSTLGVRLSIDDFGTGYSSLNYLKLLPIQALKLDKSFVHDIESDEDDVAICNATIALAHNLGLSVIAVGVETEAQRRLLASHHCDFMQGYLFSRPLPAAAVPPFIRERETG